MGKVTPSSSLDAPAFRALYEAELPYVSRTLKRLGVAGADVEDLIHDVFVVVYRRWEEYDPCRPLKPWLFGIAFRMASNYRSRAHRRSEVSTATIDTIDPASDPTEADPFAERQSLVLRALATIEVTSRAVCVLHDIENQTAPSIALALEIPLNTVYSRLRNGRKKIAAAIRRLRLERGES